MNTCNTFTYMNMCVCTCMCLYQDELFVLCMYMHLYVCIYLYQHEYACMCLYMHASICLCMYSIFCFAQDSKRKTLPRPGPGPLQCAVKKGIKGQQNHSDNSGTRTPVYMVTCWYFPLSQLCLWHRFKFVGASILVTNTYSCRQYMHIHTYTYTYQQYMHIHAHTCNTCICRHIHACANHGREGSLGGCGRR
jgi:hypothetical protein